MTHQQDASLTARHFCVEVAISAGPISRGGSAARVIVENNLRKPMSKDVESKKKVSNRRNTIQ
jgi:hypothetical protein